MLIETVCLYNCIEFGSQLSLPFFLLYAWAASIAAFAIFVCGDCLGGVNRVSVEINERLNRHLFLKKNKWFCRFLRSCRDNRINIKGSSYIDNMLALVLQDQVIDLTVNLLLLQN